jgi:hypothetical protein
MLELVIFLIRLKNSQTGIGFKSLAYDFISRRIQINTGVEDDKAARDFIASIALADRLSTSKVKLSDLNSDPPGLGRLLKHKQRLKIMWHENLYPA